ATSLLEMLAKVQGGMFKPPREVDGRVPRALEAICLKAMAVRPEDRYASVQELRDDVERWMADQPVSAYVEPLSQRIDRALAKSRIGAEFGEWGPLLLGCAVIVVV